MSAQTAPTMSRAWQSLAEMKVLARSVCPLCAVLTPHHTNAEGSIGGGDRHPIYDLHAVEDASGVGLVECLAGDLWLAWERS